jgi:hypothetical protein
MGPYKGYKGMNFKMIGYGLTWKKRFSENTLAYLDEVPRANEKEKCFKTWTS